MPKEKKRTSELEAMIWEEVRKHHAWAAIVGIAVCRAIGPREDGANWYAAFVTGRKFVPVGAEDFARELASRFDLA